MLRHRPLPLPRYAGPGSHLSSVGFSGDAIASWKSLRFQPYFTVLASNLGYGWWSHDIGGHMFGYRDEELRFDGIRWGPSALSTDCTRIHYLSMVRNLGTSGWMLLRVWPKLSDCGMR